MSGLQLVVACFGEQDSVAADLSLGCLKATLSLESSSDARVQGRAAFHYGRLAHTRGIGAIIAPSLHLHSSRMDCARRTIRSEGSRVRKVLRPQCSTATLQSSISVPDGGNYLSIIPLYQHHFTQSQHSILNSLQKHSNIRTKKRTKTGRKSEQQNEPRTHVTRQRPYLYTPPPQARSTSTR